MIILENIAVLCN